MGAQTQIEDDSTASGGGGAIKPTVVLVHGGLEDASIWHLVIPRLQRDGYPVVAFANPLRSLGIDVAYLRSVLDGIEGPVILVPTPTAGLSSPRLGTTQRSAALSTQPPPCLRSESASRIASNGIPASTSPHPST